MQAAQEQKALGSKDAAQAHTALIEQVDPDEHGKYDGAIGGQAVFKPQAGSRELDAAQPVERFGAAAVLFDAAASINWATPASAVVTAGQHLHWTTQSDCHVAAGATLSTVAGGSASLFTHAGGIGAIAANGPVSLQAHTDGLEIIADKEVVAVSVSAAIAIQAKTKIVLQAGTASITLDGGDITFACPGKFTAKGAQHVFDGGGSSSANLRNLPGELAKEAQHWIAVDYIDPETGEGIPDVDYEIQFDNGPMLTGTLDESGQARHEGVPNRPVKVVRYKPRSAQKEKPWAPLEDLLNGN